MKKTLFMMVCSLIGAGLTAFAEEAHDHSNCNHDHAAEESHAGHDHEGGACKGEHDHDHEGGACKDEHDHNHEGGACKDEHDHDHEGGACKDEHDHDHEGGACKDEHDHNHEGGACKDEHDHNHEGGACSSSSGGVVVKADARARSILGMQVQEVPAVTATLTGSLYGRLTIPEHAVETYALPVAGRISLRVKSAQQVQAGDILYTVQSPDYADRVTEAEELQYDLERCEAEVQVMEDRNARLREVGSRNSELEAQLSFKKAEKRRLQQSALAARNRVRMLSAGAEETREDGLPTLAVRARTAGTVRNVGFTQGSWGEQGAAVITMSRRDAVEITAPLYAGNMPQVERVQAYVPMGREMKAVAGTWRIADQVDPDTQTRTLFFTPETAPEGVPAGTLCRLDLFSGDDAGSVSIPDSAIVKVGTDDVVFLETGEGNFVMVKVQAGASRRGMTPVRGLTPGQRVVVKGGYELKFLLPAGGGTKKAGHFHADGKFHEGEH
ncbi:MAG: efflux RND transporter periplasmic adaptor subunit [Akkermansia sp.]|nr:efflux RND transporter periplasmic adaptor subunit [Akkermansia sp.]